MMRPSLFRQYDRSEPFDFGERFDVTFCPEVAEHLDPNDGATLVRSSDKHADLIYISAAAPDQIFNDSSFICDDWPRRKM